MPDGRPTLKERLENHIVIVFLTAIATGFVAGFSAHVAITPSSPGTTSSPSVDWQATAKEKGWVDRSLCPAMPVMLRLLSPGTNAILEHSGGYLRADVVIDASQPLPKDEAIGYIFNPEGDTNFYVEFPYLTQNEQRTVFRTTGEFASFPTKIEKPTRVYIWAVAIDDKSKLGSFYGSLDQIKAVSNTIFISEKVAITVVP